jgi:hypothetical protein
MPRPSSLVLKRSISVSLSALAWDTACGGQGFGLAGLVEPVSTEDAPVLWCSGWPPK